MSGVLKNRLTGLNPNNVKIVLIGFRVQLYKQNVGGNLGNLVLLWKVPQNINQSQQHETVIRVKDMLHQYECRATARELREQFLQRITFYKELDQIVEDFGKAADERRNSQVAHLPIAVSVPQIISKVLRYFTN